MKNKPGIIAVSVIATIVLVLCGLVFLLLGNKEAMKTELKASFEAATGMKLEIQGEAVLKIFPLPHLSVDSMYVPNEPGAKTSFLLTIKQMDISPVFTSLFKKNIAIRKLQVSGVKINLETMPDGKLNLQGVSGYWKDGVFQAEAIRPPAGDSDNIAVSITGAQINYTNPEGATLEYNDFNAFYSVDAAQAKSVVDIRFDYQGRPFAIAGKITGGLAQLFSSSSMAVSASVTSDKSTVVYDGAVGYKDSRGLCNGVLQLNTDDVAYWVRLYRGEQTGSDAADYKKLPLSAQTKVVMSDTNKISFTDIMLDGATIKGNAQVDMTLPNQFAIRALINKLNLEDIAANGFLVSAKEANNTRENNNYIVQGKPPAPLSVTSSVKIEDTVYNGKHLMNTSFTTDMEGEELTIPQLLSTLPGDAHLNFSGIGKAGLTGFLLEGQVDIQGNNFVEMLNTFQSAGAALPAEDFKLFHMRTNTLISRTEVRLSELVARIGTISVSGGLIAKLGNRTGFQASLGISGLNLDHIAMFQ